MKQTKNKQKSSSRLTYLDLLPKYNYSHWSLSWDGFYVSTVLYTECTH